MTTNMKKTYRILSRTQRQRKFYLHNTQDGRTGKFGDNGQATGAAKFAMPETKSGKRQI